ncbi:hypothetical protein, partial [Klebsiella pneumoniae]|uniref:hypothetical protein n=1 Tax=Klebsiella pneumoniae TaxID=573 RepID=UPI0013D4A815
DDTALLEKFQGFDQAERPSFQENAIVYAFFRDNPAPERIVQIKDDQLHAVLLRERPIHGMYLAPKPEDEIFYVDRVKAGEFGWLDNTG